MAVMLAVFMKQLIVGQLLLHVLLQVTGPGQCYVGCHSQASSAVLALPGNSSPLVAEATSALSH